jgi:hypothetical protein
MMLCCFQPSLDPSSVPNAGSDYPGRRKDKFVATGGNALAAAPQEQQQQSAPSHASPAAKSQMISGTLRMAVVLAKHDLERCDVYSISH